MLGENVDEEWENVKSFKEYEYFLRTRENIVEQIHFPFSKESLSFAIIHNCTVLYLFADPKDKSVSDLAFLYFDQSMIKIKTVFFPHELSNVHTY